MKENPVETINKIETDLSKLQTDTEKKKLLYLTIKNLIQQGVKEGDAYEGRNTKAFRWVIAELSYMKKIEQLNKLSTL